MSDWISCDERLPLELLNGSDVYKDIEVIVTDGDNVSLHTFAAGSVGEDWREWSNYGDINPSEIIAWQHKPEPPKKPEVQFNTKQEG